MQAIGKSGLGFRLHHSLRVDPKHQVRPRPLLAHPALHDGPLGQSDVAHVRRGHDRLDEDLQTKISGKTGRQSGCSGRKRSGFALEKYQIIER